MDDETVRARAARAAVSQGTFDSNTAIDPPFSGSLTDQIEVSSHHVRASGSSLPTETLGSSPVAPLGRATPIPFERGTRVGDYEIEGKIGEGAMGAVYRAVHPSLGKHVAVKVMNPRLCDDPGAVERFAREARTVAAIRHPGIVDVFGFGTFDDGRAYLIMEWLEGATLGTHLKQRQLAFDDALDVFDQIARALEAAHDKRVIHRDLSWRPPGDSLSKQSGRSVRRWIGRRSTFTRSRSSTQPSSSHDCRG